MEIGKQQESFPLTPMDIAILSIRGGGWKNSIKKFPFSFSHSVFLSVKST